MPSPDSMVRKALCSLCDREIALKTDGTFRQHQAWLGGSVQFPPSCKGVGLTPSQTAETRIIEHISRVTDVSIDLDGPGEILSVKPVGSGGSDATT